LYNERSWRCSPPMRGRRRDSAEGVPRPSGNDRRASVKAIVDAEACIGCGLCADACPAVFEMGDDNIAKVKLAMVPKDAEASCREAATACPTEAIKLQDS